VPFARGLGTAVVAVVDVVAVVVVPSEQEPSSTAAPRPPTPDRNPRLVSGVGWLRGVDIVCS
jgi:hypothetical protein